LFKKKWAKNLHLLLSFLCCQILVVLVRFHMLFLNIGLTKIKNFFL
jgi:hypothetical protein